MNFMCLGLLILITVNPLLSLQGAGGGGGGGIYLKNIFGGA